MSGATTNVESSNEGGNESSEQTPGAGDEFKAITSQEEFDRIITDRVKRERAKFADYKDLKSKADQFDKLAEANKSEIEKANDRIAAAEATAAQALIAATRYRVATKFGISDEHADLYLTGTDEETLTKQAEGLSKLASDRKKQGNVVPKEGATSDATPSDERAFVRDLFSAG